MKRLRTRAALAASTAVAAAGIAVATAVPALAVTFIGRDVPTTATIAPGGSGPVSFTYQNTGGSGLIKGAGTQVVFTAPGSTTFAPQSSLPGLYSSDGTNWVSNYMTLTGCTLSNSSTTLTCQGTAIGPGNISWPAGGYFRFSPTVTVSATAPSGTTLPRGAATITYPDPNGTTYTITDGTLNVATPPAPGANAKCLDVTGGGRANGTNVQTWQCLGNHPNQTWVIDRGQIILAATVGTSSPMCLSTLNSRNNSDNILLWRCMGAGQPGYNNQIWVVQGGKLIIRNTIGTATPMCADAGSTRNNGDNVFLYQCGNGNPNQSWVVQDGAIKLADTI